MNPVAPCLLNANTLNEMLNSIKKRFFSDTSSAFICFALIAINLMLLFAENYVALTARCSIIFLSFNLALSLSVILSHNYEKTSIYRVLSTDPKTNIFNKLSFEFFKISGILLQTILLSSIAAKYFPPQMTWISDSVAYIFSILIFIRWNSTEFLKNMVGIMRKLYSFNPSDGVDFTEVLVADVWLSFSKPSTMLVRPEYISIRLLFFW